MIRKDFYKKINKTFGVSPIVALLGPGQCGKTTIAREFLKEKGKYRAHNYFDLEKKSDLDHLANPETALSGLKGLIVIDKIQRRPDLFQSLRVLVDRPKNKQKYLILGSAQRELIKQSSETLAGRISYLELTPFNFNETDNLEKLWLRGGFPKSFLTKSEENSFNWRSDYVRTFLERDIPSLGIRISPHKLENFWMMLAHYHGNVFNASELSRSLGWSYNTIQDYADILTHTLMIRQLQPWLENINKRQVKSPKIYFRDSGIFHHHLGIKEKHALLRHPKLGASWEGFVMEEIIRAIDAAPNECYFWATHNNAKLDLLIIKNGRRFGFEIKFSQTPQVTRGTHSALQDLRLEKIFAIHPGNRRYKMHDKVEACGAREFLRSCGKIFTTSKEKAWRK
ncbi:MAG: ATP-binding protein [Alphaproteobacteria bacterium]|nr:ATP-binding protein [Alphaproteobacteria bacterium]